MRILLCLNKDIYSANALNYLMDFFKGDEVKICFSEGVGVKKEIDDLEDLLHWEQSVPIGDLFPAIEKSDSNSKNRFKTFNEISDFYNAEILHFANINVDGAKYLKETWQVDLVVSIRYGVILKEEFISCPKVGILNLHSGILPKYRGIMSTFWAMLNGEKQIGSTLHKITDNKIDSGEILAISKRDISAEKSLMYNIASLYEQGCKNIITAVNDIRKCGKIDVKFKDENTGPSSYHSYPTKSDFEDFKKKFKILDEKEFFEEIINLYLN